MQTASRGPVSRSQRCWPQSVRHSPGWATAWIARGERLCAPAAPLASATRPTNLHGR